MRPKQKVVLTRHAKERFAQRMGVLGKAKMQEIANEAFYNGCTNANCGNKKVGRWMQQCTCGNKYKVRLLNNHAFTFRNGRLITVMSIPDDLKDPNDNSNS